MSVVDASFMTPLPAEEIAAMPLAGGIVGMGFQCGQVWGAALAAGAQAYQVYGPGPQAEAAAVFAAQKLVEAFQASYKSVNCADVTQINWKTPQKAEFLAYFLRGGVVRCFSMTASFSRAAIHLTETAFEDGQVAPEGPISCAAVLARKMGATEQQAVVAAGLAGGIGLSGGACGALGAAVWLRTLKSGKRSFDLADPDISNLVDRFVETTEIKFDCAEVVGRAFSGIEDHAGYLKSGGCAKLLEVLAA